ncbi:ClC family H(+)/Cl(-) exchange transporter [Lentilactobacillus kefiri]|uniref:Cl-channel voltage-gated family protein n=1 Tax=Lentilactobacillus kefiri DSM 20587 = JCM 5818 TaxID=1423764 RepID=A0A8E1RJC2_LENKE|nr:ClC family H(+)/Cl(-) exchange transporter [Lentilactobacillus kefiri]KRL58224.1 Cl- channel voltage-gated family protein [Lentilactobacillus parakefiri DSM 10551]KRM52825.1 Cl- channel voltage-gated family protein [Lentilactobacillus kefiri DSM 20587 = JCM 5818]MCJ2161993.1 chloride channel protein [Lentilactobacillus kefiri]MDH5108627.1 chloride channel protein [Lentilactobacillus kefiri]MDM7493321.1 chloride channel protein [Lentilactobacillus kefiri]
MIELQVRGSYRLSQIKTIVNGIIIGVLAGSAVSMFRWSIGHMTNIMQYLYVNSIHHLHFLFMAIVINVIIGLIVGWFLKQQPDIKGSGIPQVEGQLLDEVNYGWWPVLWRKFIGGILAIGSGLYLGREGPSIQLGSTLGQGVAHFTKQVGFDRQVLISSGAAAGLSAAFNAPIASTLFVLEEIYHNFSTNIWIVSLTSAVTSDMVAAYVFGLKPVLYMRSEPLPLKYFIWVIVLGIALGVLGRLYQMVILRMGKWYSHTKIPWYFNGIIPLLLVIPLGAFFPQLLGGGSKIILQLSSANYPTLILCLYFIIRFVFSMISYGSGLPGGIFLPILCLGGLIGAIVGSIAVNLGLMSPFYFSSFIIMGMAGYFAAISKAPFTAILLITEMVGTLSHLLGLAVVSLIAYGVLDMLNGKPVYYSMLQQLLKVQTKMNMGRTAEIMETVYAGSDMDGKKVSQIHWPNRALLTKIQRNGVEIVPAGNTLIRWGDTLFINVSTKNQRQITQQIISLTTET